MLEWLETLHLHSYDMDREEANNGMRQAASLLKKTRKLEMSDRQLIERTDKQTGHIDKEEGLQQKTVQLETDGEQTDKEMKKDRQTS